MFDLRKRTYARLLLKIGVGLKGGETVFLDIPVDAFEFARIAAAEAYSLGAADVIVLWRDRITDRMRLEKLKNEEHLPLSATQMPEKPR